MTKLKDILKDIKELELEDDGTEYGGASFSYEKVKDILPEFLGEEKLGDRTLNDFNSYLNQIGIKEIVRVGDKYRMIDFVGKKVRELNKFEKEYLESIASGYYNGESKLQDGTNEVTIDFHNGLSVAGRIINEDYELVWELEEDGLIYNPKI